VREVGAFEAKDTLGALLDLVERGEEVRIARRGKPVARLVPDRPAQDREAARAAARRIVEGRKGVTLGGVATLKELIEDGRR
jgi:prevent-host-death family protein